jgi:hypothetical protein
MPTRIKTPHPRAPLPCVRMPYVERVMRQVEFENITMTVQVPVRAEAIPTIGNTLLAAATPTPKRAHSVLQGCSGVLSPGSMTLVRG